MGYDRNRNNAYARHMTTSNSLSNKKYKPLLASRIETEAMCCEIFPWNGCCLNYINVRHIMPHQGPIKLSVHTPNPPVHPQLVVHLKEVDKPHICISCPFCTVVDVLLYRIIVISIQAVSWPSITI
jgi:hypothetical protein